MDAVSDLLEQAIGFAFLAGVPGYFALQPLTAMRFSGGWRTAALIPLLFSVPLTLWCIFALLDGSNIWPLTMILFAPLGALYLLVVLGLRYRKTGKIL
jgi:hypothetical protein